MGVHPEIDNPDYVSDDELYSYDAFGSVGIDIWQVKSGSIFDNIIITDSLEEAQEFMKETYSASKDGEKEMFDTAEEERRAKEEEEEDEEDEEEDEDEEPTKEKEEL